VWLNQRCTKKNSKHRRHSHVRTAYWQDRLLASHCWCQLCQKGRSWKYIGTYIHWMKNKFFEKKIDKIVRINYAKIRRKIWRISCCCPFKKRPRKYEKKTHILPMSAPHQVLLKSAMPKRTFMKVFCFSFMYIHTFLRGECKEYTCTCTQLGWWFIKFKLKWV